MHSRKKLLSGTTFTSIGALISRVLGLLREIACANLWGMSSGIMDAFVLALRVPFFFRRLFSEGVLGVSYIPVLSYEIEKAQRKAVAAGKDAKDADFSKIWKIVSTVFVLLAIIMTIFVLICEAACFAVMFLQESTPVSALFLKLLAISLPSVLLICLIAQLAATLQAFHRFLVPTFPPIFMNTVVLIQVCTIAMQVESQETQAIIVTTGMTCSALFPVAFLWFALWRGNGFYFHFDFQATKPFLRKILRWMLPMMLGLMIIPLNALLSSLIAWVFSAPVGGAAHIWWLPGKIAYPMQQGAVSALALGERLSQFPLGLLGIPVAVTIFPMLSRVAAQGNRRVLSVLFTRGLCMTLFLAIPGTVGLMLIGTPLVRIFFEHGKFSPEDAVRAGNMVTIYCSAVWAFCLLPVLIRGFYVLGDRRTPMRAGTVIAGANILLNLVLIWFFAEVGLAVSTAALTIFQVFWMMIMLHRRLLKLALPMLAMRTFRCVAASAVMAGVCFLPWMQHILTLAGEDGKHFHRLLLLVVFSGTAGGAYLLAYGVIKLATRGGERREEEG